MSAVFDPTPCALGEGPLWHPERGELFWFDILGKRLHARKGAAARQWQFDEHVSAAGWVSEAELLIASETKLMVFDIETGASRLLCPLEAGTAQTRSNDGRADRSGGFWIGTMGKSAEPGAGAIYRWFRGEVRKLYDNITISNAICFSPDGARAYFTDTPTGIIQTQALDGDGWPVGDRAVFGRPGAEGRNPDGAVVDAAGNLWCAEWGSGEVACYAPDGALLRRVAVDAPQVSCPAFGGEAFNRLFVTTARQDMTDDALAAAPLSGAVFELDPGAVGLPEPRVIL
ncbi:SMP-30/gluconolactonase/LRE family protein [Poseidonocella sedimentorum]|uniref:Sugar lactone lactonase YvrE n=1 Tax=Poseidonocella sedimentorum TaxID=871652 RepID=A0A1I6D678_9RHOB|nr:SMP-30/gluconolactonase/LRE family protein [Poseidonocella sedimentorum]SFR00956.1 Sugar lactone lactonase YvrE [Poseidonocella sedimentorum]